MSVIGNGMGLTVLVVLVVLVGLVALGALVLGDVEAGVGLVSAGAGVGLVGAGAGAFVGAAGDCSLVVDLFFFNSYFVLAALISDSDALAALSCFQAYFALAASMLAPLGIVFEVL